MAAPATNLPAVVQPTVVPVPGETSASAVAAREKAAVEARFLVAINRPRVFDQSRLRLLTACKRPKFAAAARYSKPVGQSKVQGFSIRFAEEARVLWGNIDVSAFLVFDDDERRIYRVVGMDLETNAGDGIDVMVEKFVERRSPQKGSEIIGHRANKEGETVYKIRATEDDLIVKVGAHLSKARRNVILSLIPADVKDECEAQIVATLRNRDADDPEGARKDILEAFWSLGVTPQQVGEFLGKPLEQINPAELSLLRTCYTAIKEGEATWAEVTEQMGAKKKGDAPASAKGTAGLGAALQKKREPKAPTDAEIRADEQRMLDEEQAR